MADSKSRRPPPKGRPMPRATGKWVALISAILVILVVWLAFFLLTACYLAPVFGGGWAWLGGTVLLALGLPLAIGIWMVRPLAGFKRAAWFVGAFGSLPLLAVLGLSAGAPSHSAGVLRNHGKKLFEQIFGPVTRSASARFGTDLSLRWADLLKAKPKARRRKPKPRPSKQPRVRPKPKRSIFYSGVRRPRPRPLDPDAAKGPRTRVRFVRRGGALMVKAEIQDRKRAKLRLVLDTGATLSALNTEAAQKLGIRLPAHPVTVELDTAGGRKTFPIAVVSRMRVGNAEVRHLTVAICDDCSPPGLYGLLGLNFTQHFVTSIDHRRRQLTLQAQRGPRNQIEDIEPFLKLSGVKGEMVGDTFQVTGLVHNRGPHPVRALRLQAALQDSAGKVVRRLATRVKLVKPRANVAFEIKGPGGKSVTRYRLETLQARW